jgi:hypothetical protein
MGAFIAGGLIFVLTLCWCFIITFADGMSDAPSQDGIEVVPWFIGGTVLSLLVVSSHWWSW